VQPLADSHAVRSVTTRNTRLAALLLTALTAFSGCANDDGGGGGGTQSLLVFNAETNRLNAYDVNAGFTKQTVIPSRLDDPQNGLDINGQICFTADGSHFIAGEDTGQPVNPPGWGYFRLDGDRIGELSATEVGEMVATFQPADDNGEPYGCGFLSDGRILTTDVGNQAAGPETGQLIVWFPPVDGVPFGTVRYCKLDIAIGTAGGIVRGRTARSTSPASSTAPSLNTTRTGS
jgi:hypothetical protein